MQTCQIHCDSCGLEISTTRNIQGYRLRLSVESRRFVGEVANLLSVFPPFDRDYDFCGKGCLESWIRAGMPSSRDPEVPVNHFWDEASMSYVKRDSAV